jgi:anti-anti-sigma factor
MRTLGQSQDGLYSLPKFPAQNACHSTVTYGIFNRHNDGEADLMEITISEFGERGTKVTLVGKLDIAGAEAVDLPLATVAGTRSNVVIDMVGVDFIASIGIRHLVMAAKAVARGSNKLVLLDPSPVVTEVLATAGLVDFLPIVRSEAEARAALTGAAG